MLTIVHMRSLANRSPTVRVLALEQPRRRTPRPRGRCLRHTRHEDNLGFRAGALDGCAECAVGSVRGPAANATGKPPVQRALADAYRRRRQEAVAGAHDRRDALGEIGIELR
jgi:hypothetical protein